MSTSNPSPPTEDPSTSTNASTELNPQRELLAEAAAALQADAESREARKPKGLGQGTLGLVGDSLGGVAIGAAAVVMGPVQGYKASGAKGLLGGALGGLAAGVAATTIGIGSGIAKFAHGSGKTMERFGASSIPDKLKVADGVEKGTRYEEQRKAVYGELLTPDGQSAPGGAAGVLAKPVENELYDVLGVGADASAADIRKAYYRMAQKYHPDKHPDDQDATAKFQKISEAYQVLSDPVQREKYHRLGAAAAADGAMMDPKALFALMFSDFEHIVGDLATATILTTMEMEAAAANADKPDGTGESPDMTKARLEKKKEFQAAREAHLVKLLNRRLEPWVRGDENAFVEHAKLEVRAMRGQPFGRDLLKTTAYVYKTQASRALDTSPLKGVNSFFDNIGDKAHSLKSQIRALEGGVKALSEAQTTAENESIDEAARREAVSTVGAVWLASVIDIESTLKHVVKAALHYDDKRKHKSPEEVVTKAEGLLVLAQIFGQA